MRKLIIAVLLALTLFAGGPVLSVTPYLHLVPQRAGNPSITVWVNTNSGVYHCPGTRWYGKTKEGRYMSQRAAQTAGYRPAYGSVCG